MSSSHARKRLLPHAVLASLVALAGLSAGPVQASDLLKPGQKAPEFELMSDRDEAVRLEEVRQGHWVLLAFYPRAFTPG
jgi:hypothetical protein